MNDAERQRLDRLMAEKVMRWGWLPFTDTDNPFIRASEKSGWMNDGAKLVAPPDWSPTTDPRAASQVIARLTELGWQVDIIVTPNLEAKVYLTRPMEYYRAVAPTWTEALCLAAKQAMDAKA